MANATLKFAWRKIVENNRINSLLIQQYLEGKLDSGQMHQLERQALDDPFLADALEGYSYAKKPVGHQLSILQRQLEQRIAIQQDNKNRYNFNWQRLSVAAAAGLIFITAGILFQMRFQPPPESPQKATERPVSALDQPLEHKAESLTGEDAPDNAVTAEIKKVPKLSRIARKLPVNSVQSEVLADKMPVVMETPQKEQGNAGSFEDFVVASALQENKVTVLNKQPDSSSNSPTAVSAIASDIRIKGELVGLTGKMDEYGIKNAEIHVSTGSEPFYTEYLKNAVRNAAGEESISGKVKLRFSVNPDGTLSNFKVIKGLTDACNAEAIRVVQQGPAWIPSGKKRTVKLTIRFPKTENHK